MNPTKIKRKQNFERVELTKHYGSEPGKTETFQNEKRSLDTQVSMIGKQIERATHLQTWVISYREGKIFQSVEPRMGESSELGSPRQQN